MCPEKVHRKFSELTGLGLSPKGLQKPPLMNDVKILVNREVEQR